jgi:hypothetical protein
MQSPVLTNNSNFKQKSEIKFQIFFKNSSIFQQFSKILHEKNFYTHIFLQEFNHKKFNELESKISEKICKNFIFLNHKSSIYETYFKKFAFFFVKILAT